MANEDLKTLEDKLSYAYDTKVAIKDAIEAKGVEVPEGTVFRDYATKIGEIETGSPFETSQISIMYPGQNMATFYYTDKDGVYKSEVNPSQIEVVLGNIFSVYVYPSNPFQGNGDANFIVSNVEKIKTFYVSSTSATEGLHVCRTTGTSAIIEI